MIVIFKLLGSLALLMFGMKSMSDALQKMAGPQLRHVLGAMTTNRITGMLTGSKRRIAWPSLSMVTVFPSFRMGSSILTPSLEMTAYFCMP